MTEPDTTRWAYHGERLWELARDFQRDGWNGRPDEWVFAIRDLIAQARQEAVEESAQKLDEQVFRWTIATESAGLPPPAICGTLTELAAAIRMLAKAAP